MNKNYSQPSRLEASFSKLKALHQRDDSVTFTPLEVMALLHLIEPRSVGWNFEYGLAVRSEADLEDCQAAIEKFKQLTLTIPSNTSSRPLAKMGRPKGGLGGVLEEAYGYASLEDF